MQNRITLNYAKPIIFFGLAILLIMVGAYIEFYITGNVINYLGL